ncbi:MAG: DNA primase [Candidatus Cloacimonetes bacterium]|nr:DNA primase [Candidatus Cloacimonadota bacterium]
MDIKVVDELLANINIVDVIRHYIPLNKAGSNFKALCPFHEEKTPSFNVSEKKQIYKCFGCGVSGNAVSFVRDYEKLSFWEAVRKVASLTGFVLPEESKSQKRKSSKTDLLFQIYELTKKHFQENLVQYGDGVRRYLEDRGITAATQKEFEFGYALNSYNGLHNYLLKNFINREILGESGLFGSNERGIYDIFRDRLMIPIHTVTGRTVAFGGRKLDEDQPGGKYINSPTTAIYTKGNELYGLNVTKYNIGKKQDYVLVSEGYLDMLRLYEHGFTNSVASLGTALTSQQISLLGRYTQNVYIIYDGDTAGLKAGIKAAGEVVKAGLTSRIVALPAGEDPDSFLLKEGKEALQERIDDASGLCEFFKNEKRLGVSTREKVRYLTNLVQEMDSNVDRDLFLNEVAESFDVSVNSLLSELRLKKTQESGKIPVPKSEKYVEEKWVLKILMDEPELLERVLEEIDATYFLVAEYKQIFETLVKHAGEFQQVSTLQMAVEPETWAKMSEILMMTEPETDIEENLRDMKLRKFNLELKEMRLRLAQSELTEEMLQHYRELKKKIRQYSSRATGKLIYN